MCLCCANSPCALLIHDLWGRGICHLLPANFFLCLPCLHTTSLPLKASLDLSAQNWILESLCTTSGGREQENEAKSLKIGQFLEAGPRQGGLLGVCTSGSWLAPEIRRSKGRGKGGRWPLFAQIGRTGGLSLCHAPQCTQEFGGFDLPVAACALAVNSVSGCVWL